MGVPKFFRWASERYPQIIQNLVDSNAPEYDNLYLDMNGIIHACSQEISNSLLIFSEEELIRAVCNYIDKLFHIIRPTKLLYMAIDGVAPRSKLNQQRQRRFLAVYREEKAKADLIKEGKPVPEAIFSRNAITPGTEFMSNLSDCLQFFIKKKISEDQSWRDIEIIFSGPENPGEGEHKIIDYIRKNKASPDWDPNQSHCLYGLDADLILLALVTHEPHFSILREEIVFRQNAAIKRTQQLDFQLLHISLLREYLGLELHCTLDFGYDLERIIDDFVLVMIFFGNDFLPHLPFCEIAQGGLNIVLDLYKKTLPLLGGYLTDEAGIDLERLELFMKKIAELERRTNLSLGAGDEDEEGSDEKDEKDEQQRLKEEKEAFDRLKEHFKDLDFEKDDDDAEPTQEDMNDYWMNSYYRQKFNDEFPETPEEMAKFKRQLVQYYVEGLSWVLNYYHNGCISWHWYYPYYYAPLASDLVRLTSLSIEFETNGPVTPFQQLMSVLPPQSSFLLPKPYQLLMTEASSPIIDFYPVEFEVDTSDSHYFDGIALIGFPDLGRLIQATAGEDSYDLTPRERSRNTFRNAVIIYHDAENQRDEESPNTRLFGGLERSSAKTEDIVLPHYENDLRPFRLCEGVLVGSHSPSGFPTFASIDFDWEYRHACVNLWGMTSRKDSIVVHPPLPKDSSTLSSLQPLIGKKCYINWPYHIEARIIGFSDANQRIAVDPSSTRTLKTIKTDYIAVQKLQYMEQLKKMPADLLKKGINIEELQTNGILVHVQKIVGVDVEFGGRIVKRYAEKEDQYPLQLMVEYDRVRADSRYQESEELPFTQRFPIGKRVLYTNSDQYGAIAQVLGHADETTETLELELKVGQAPMDMSFGHKVAREENDGYYPLQHVCKATGLSTQSASLLTSGLFIDKPMADIGLNLKFTGRNQQLMGYCRGTTMGDQRTGNTYKKWEFSNEAVELIKDYLSTFPIIAKILVLFGSDEKTNKRSVDISSLIPEKTDRVEFVRQVEEYFEKTGIRRKRYVPCDSLSLSKDSIKKIEHFYGQRAQAAILIPMRIRTQSDKVIEPALYESVISYEKQHTIMKSLEQQSFKDKRSGSNAAGTSSPPIFQPSNKSRNERRFRLGDRVVTMLDKGAVPFGLYGTVVSVQDQKVDVILDKECFSGSNLEGFCSEKRGLCISKWRLYNLSDQTSNQQVVHKSRGGQGYQLGSGSSYPSIDSVDYWRNLNMTEDDGVVKVKVNHQRNQDMQKQVDQQSQNLNWQQQQELYKQTQRKNYYTRQDQFVKKHFTPDEHQSYRKVFPNVHQQPTNQQQNLNWQQQLEKKNEKKKKEKKINNNEEPTTNVLLKQMFESVEPQKPITSFFPGNETNVPEPIQVEVSIPPVQPQQPTGLLGSIVTSLESSSSTPYQQQPSIHTPPPQMYYPPPFVPGMPYPPPPQFHPQFNPLIINGRNNQNNQNNNNNNNNQPKQKKEFKPKNQKSPPNHQNNNNNNVHTLSDLDKKPKKPFVPKVKKQPQQSQQQQKTLPTINQEPKE